MYAPAARPTPAQPISRPSPKLPAEKDSVARNGSPTLTKAFETMPMFHATRTVSNGRERRTSTRPSPRSRQWPRVSALASCRSRCGICAISAAETRNVTELIQ